MKSKVVIGKVAEFSEFTLSSQTVMEGDRLVASYHSRLFSLVVIKQLMHLCREVQKHRGLSMGLLAGNRAFAANFDKLQYQIDRRITLLYSFCHAQYNSLTTAEVNQVSELWGTVRIGWHDDSVLENFHFHCHFIERLLQMVIRLCNNFDVVLTDHTERQPIAHGNATKRLLFAFVCRQLPITIEYLGMVRALSVHAATRGESVSEYDKKLKYFCHCVRQEKIIVMDTADKLHHSIGDQMPALLTLKTYEYKLDAFIEKIMQYVVSQQSIRIASNDIFSMATEIIDVYWRVIDDGIDQLHSLQENTLESWCVVEK